MDDFWNISETTPSTLDNFFDEESDVSWTGTIKEGVSSQSLSSFGDANQNSINDELKSQNWSSFSSGSLSSIIDNISIHSDSAAPGIGGNRGKRVGKVLGDKIESFKSPSVSIKWKNSGSGSCLQCNTKDEEIFQLKQRLERAYSRHTVTLPPETTIQKMLLGHPTSLESYKMAEDKICLLELALSTMDSSTILAILVFMRNSMKRTSFLDALQTRPQAAQVYINYLKQRLEHTEVLEILGMLGRTEEAAMFMYELAISSQTTETQLRNLKNALQNYFVEPSLGFELKLVKQHLDLIELQVPIDTIDGNDQNNSMLIEHPRATSLVGQSLLTTLYYCSMYHWQAFENQPKSPMFLRKKFNIPDKQFLWAVIRARAKVKHWPLPSDLENLMVTRGLMGTLSALSGKSGGGKVVKNSLPIESVIDTVASSGAPSKVLASYISLLSSNEAKLKIGLAYKCHLAVIEAFSEQKNRDGLENYMKEITPGTSEYFLADQVLKNTKWKT